MRVVGLICGKVWLGSILLVYGAGIHMDAAQAKPKPAPPPRPAPKAAPPPRTPMPKQQATKAVPADQLGKLLNMSPEDREKSLSKLQPAQRARVENQLSTLDKMTPEQRAQRMDQISRLEKLPPARRQAVNQEMQRINQIPVGPQRRAALHSPEFQQNFSPDEQQLIRERFPGAAK